MIGTLEAFTETRGLGFGVLEVQEPRAVHGPLCRRDALDLDGPGRVENHRAHRVGHQGVVRSQRTLLEVGVLVVVAFAIVVINIGVDLIHSLLDPRIRVTRD